MTDGPQDPLTAFQEAAAQLHECHLSYVKAGFTPAQALYLCGQILRSAMGAQNRPEDP